MPDISPFYRPRNPQNSAYYRCVEDHFEIFEQVYEECFERQYGFFRPHVRKVVYRYPGPDLVSCVYCRGPFSKL